jgi:hypothetical protein
MRALKLNAKAPHRRDGCLVEDPDASELQSQVYGIPEAERPLAGILTRTTDMWRLTSS